MSDPVVCAVMLTKNRPEMARRAVRSFQAQTYKRKHLLVWDTGSQPGAIFGRGHEIYHVRDDKSPSIGQLRNRANCFPHPYLRTPDIFVHWDDDDWSAPTRIAEQVALLQNSGADAVGYWELLFWRCPRGGESGASPKGCDMASHAPEEPDGEAWLYSGRCDYAPATTLCYWHKTWAQKPFPDLPRPGNQTGEEYDWVRNLNLVTDESFHGPSCSTEKPAPRVIASIHGGNTSPFYTSPLGYPLMIQGQLSEFRRVPEWNAHCREVMRL